MTGMFGGFEYILYLMLNVVLIFPILLVLFLREAGLWKGKNLWFRAIGFIGIFVASAFGGVLLFRYDLSFAKPYPYLTALLLVGYFYLLFRNYRKDLTS